MEAVGATRWDEQRELLAERDSYGNQLFQYTSLDASLDRVSLQNATEFGTQIDKRVERAMNPWLAGEAAQARDTSNAILGQVMLVQGPTAVELGRNIDQQTLDASARYLNCRGDTGCQRAIQGEMQNLTAAKQALCGSDCLNATQRSVLVGDFSLLLANLAPLALARVPVKARNDSPSWQQSAGPANQASALDEEVAALRRIGANAPATRDLDRLINLKGEAQQFADAEWRAGRSPSSWNDMTQPQKLEWMAKADAKLNLGAVDFFVTKHGNDNGFDVSFWKMENGKPQLYVPEVKDIRGTVSENGLSAYGVGFTASGQDRTLAPNDRFFLMNKQELQKSIEAADLAPEIRQYLKVQLDRNQYKVILYGNEAKGTTFSSTAIDALKNKQAIPEVSTRAVPFPSRKP
jgi:hypothetical protein